MPGCRPEAPAVADEPPRASAPKLSEITDDDFVVALTPSGRSVTLEVAKSPVKRAKGLMFRRSIPEGTGMLFDFEQIGEHSIWMFQCETSLDLIWLDERRRVTHVETDVPPCRDPDGNCPSYRPNEPSAKYVIEVGGQRAAGLGIEPGVTIELRPLARTSP